MSDDLDHLQWVLSELQGDDNNLADAVRDVERIRLSVWAEQDLPAALSYLLEVIQAYRYDATELAKIVRKSIPDDDETNES
jgi:hypothetical protein